MQPSKNFNQQTPSLLRERAGVRVITATDQTDTASSQYEVLRDSPLAMLQYACCRTKVPKLYNLGYVHVQPSKNFNQQTPSPLRERAGVRVITAADQTDTASSQYEVLRDSPLAMLQCAYYRTKVPKLYNMEFINDDKNVRHFFSAGQFHANS